MIVVDKITGKSFRTEEEYQQFLKLVEKEKINNLTKKEQLKEVFMKVIFEYIHKNIPIDLHNIEVLSNLLLREVTIRTNL